VEIKQGFTIYKVTVKAVRRQLEDIKLCFIQQSVNINVVIVVWHIKIHIVQFITQVKLNTDHQPQLGGPGDTCNKTLPKSRLPSLENAELYYCRN